MVDDFESESTIHIRVDSSHIQKDGQFRLSLLEQLIQSNYEDVTMTKHVNEYGLLTDIWINFHDAMDATHFKLRYQLN